MSQRSDRFEREIAAAREQLSKSSRDHTGAANVQQPTVGAGRGRSGTTPAKLPPRGWKHIPLQLYEGISEDRILANAAAVTFYALLALFPGLAALVSIYGLFANPATIASHLDLVAGVLPGGAIDVIGDQLARLTAQGSATLGISFAVSLAVSLWSANGGIKALFDALNVVYQEREERSFVKLSAMSLLFTIGLIGFLIAALACVVASSAVPIDWPLPVGSILGLGRWALLLMIAAVALAVIFRYGPCRSRPHWRWITWGGAFAALAWLATSALFSWYAGNFGSFNKVYGSLGAVVGFMTWMWISVIVVLVGAKLNAVIERESEVGSTKTDPAAREMQISCRQKTSEETTT
jgi:membrane protein